MTPELVRQPPQQKLGHKKEHNRQSKVATTATTITMANTFVGFSLKIQFGFMGELNLDMSVASRQKIATAAA